ncbi:MAG: hypothetical protein ABIH28_01450 [archaeon]
MNKKNKKGLSEIMGYLLLVSFAIFMSFLVYEGLKSYVPTKSFECPDGVSIFIQSVECEKVAVGDGTYTYDLKLNIKNNGRYNIAGYFLHATINESQLVATTDLVPFLLETKGTAGGTFKFNNAVLFEISTTGNFVNVSTTAFARFNDLPKQIYSIDVLPIRFQKEENRLRMVSCGKATVREAIICP